MVVTRRSSTVLRQNDVSYIWLHFTPTSATGSFVQCNHCTHRLQCRPQNRSTRVGTWNLWSHFQSFHRDIYAADQASEQGEVVSAFDALTLAAKCYRK